MFKVEVDTFEDYLAFDPARREDLEAFDRLVVSTAPGLERYFHAGTPAGQLGMRFKLLGYGPFHYTATNGQRVEWPTIGVALQKNYISVYVAAKEPDGIPVTERFRGWLGESRMGAGPSVSSGSTSSMPKPSANWSRRSPHVLWAARRNKKGARGALCHSWSSADQRRFLST
jgi:hypothetical protein